MATIDRDGDLITVQAELREKELVKQVPGARWDSTRQLWTVPLSWGACQVLRGVFHENLLIEEGLGEWAWQEKRDRIDTALQLRTAPEATLDYTAALPDGTWSRLYPFQRAGAQFLFQTERVLLADEMGLGKTIQSIMALRLWQAYHQDALPALVVCNNTMKRTWAEELAKWAPELRVAIVTGTKVHRTKAIRLAEEGEVDVLIVHWDVLRLHSRLAGYGSIRLSDGEKEDKELNAVKWRTVILDEAHRGKNPDTKQTRASWAVVHDARYRLALTGTPIANSPADLWAIMHGVAPDDWPAKTRFQERYCMQAWGGFGGMTIVGIRPETADEFYRILDPRFIRRLKAVVQPQLPPKTYTLRHVQMTAKQEKAYRDIQDRMLTELDNEEIMVVTNNLARNTRLSQFAAAYAELVNDGQDVHLIEPSCKVDALVELLEELGDTPCVVFAQSRQLIELCETRLTKLKIPFGSIHGKINEEDRYTSQQRLAARDINVLLATLGAGGESINLTTAPVEIMLQRSWSLIKNSQAEDRIHRIGQTSPKVEIIDVITDGTVEEYRAERLEEKAEMFEEVVRDKQRYRELIAHGQRKQPKPKRVKAA